MSVKLVALVLVSATAHAQVPAPSAYQPRPDPDDQRLLAIGEISNTQQVLGTAIAIFPGFGLGQAVEGRWRERGWIFTLGEAGSLGVYALAASCAFTKGQSCSDTAYDIAVVGVISLAAFHVAGILDAAIAPVFHNRRVHELRARIAPAQGGIALTF